MYVYVYTLLIGHDILVHNSDSLHTGYLMITLSVYHSYIANTARTQCITAFNNHFCCIAASVTFLHILFCVRLLIIMYLHHSLVLLHSNVHYLYSFSFSSYWTVCGMTTIRICQVIIVHAQDLKTAVAIGTRCLVSSTRTHGFFCRASYWLSIKCCP